jgi:hypothetical protein
MAAVGLKSRLSPDIIGNLGVEEIKGRMLEAKGTVRTRYKAMPQ